MKTSTFFWRLLGYRPGLYLLNLLAWTLIHMAPLVPGLLTKAFFDHLEGTHPFPYGATAIAALLVAAALARIALIYCGFLTDVAFRFRLAALLRRNLLAHVLRAPGARAIPGSPGEAISNFRDDVEQAEEATSWSVDTLGLVGFVVAASWILLSIDAQLTVIVFVPLILVVTAAQIATARIRKYREASRESTAQVTGAISEMFGSVLAIQVAGAEQRIVDRFARLGESRRQSMIRDKLLTETLSSVFNNSVNLGTGIILLLAGFKMRGGSFTIGDFSLFVYYLTFVTQLISNVGNFMTYYKQMGVSFDRLKEMLRGASPTLLVKKAYIGLGKKEGRRTADGERVREERAARRHEGEPLAPSIQAEPLRELDASGLTYRYPDTGRGIEEIDLTLPRGSFTVVTGMVGSGKTTLLRTLLGLLPAERGTIRWNGEPVAEPADFFVPPQSAYTAQIPRLYSATLRDNILLGALSTPDELARALHTAVLEEDVARLRDGLETMVGPRGVKLSGGQAQRTAAARMLARDAQLYVFDDLSSALDVETERKLWERLFEAKGNTTCLVVSHRKAALARADRIVLLREGRIEAQGTASELLAASESFHKLWQGESPEEEG
ncbi:ABC transporter ATP-binding protein [Cohnella sp. JJ-181]|uniref:ABC transporter ATP-binding protein n=1 Tax=Cohnella rhizoplanae TaxID=2974897 RepID=UPI0022FF7194|nr:ABC transporter ATP-binding protein [Cohnella sp. JJ-181]CAI6083403.1 putative multidrug resistance ABC transporter ATP-binding/permease protein YheI [Cohnella sp. JJ-181]